MRKPFRDQDLLAALEKHLGARFVYQEEPPAAAPKEGITLPDGRSLAAALGTIPPQWREELHKATTLGNLQEILAVVQRVRERDFALGQALQRLADGFAHDLILKAIEQAGEADDRSPQ